MKLLICGAVTVCALFYTADIAAQSAGCPTGFTMTAAEAGEETADLNLDGNVCRSEPDVSPTGVVETMVIDNSAPACGCPDAFLPRFDPLNRADRNEDTFVCVKTVIVGPPGEIIIKQIFIDNRKCHP